MTLQPFAPPVDFDYDQLPAAKADALRSQAAKIRDAAKKTAATIIEIGRDLLAVKQSLDYGLFVKWVKAEFPFTVRTAQLYIGLAVLAEGRSEMVSLLAPSTAYRLSSKSAAPEVVTEVLARVGSGAIVSDCEVKEMLAEAAFNRRQAERKELEGKKRSRAKRQRQHREAEIHQERLRREADARKADARTVIARLGANNVQYLLEVMTRCGYLFEQELRSEIAIASPAEAAQ